MTSPYLYRTKGEGFIRRGLKFCVKYFIVAFFLLLIIKKIGKVLDWDLSNVMATPEFLEKAKAEPIKTFLCLSLFGPFLEEILFRLWISFKKRHIFISVFVLAYVVLTLFMPHSHDVCLLGTQSDYFEHPLLKTGMSMAVALPLLLVSDRSLAMVRRKFGHTLICISLYAFALLHITNIDCHWSLYPVAVVKCMPQLVLGTTITFFRLGNGFMCGFLFHALWNFIVFGLVFIL